MMDVEHLENRLSMVMPEMTIVQEDGTIGLSDAYTALRQEIAQALTADPHQTELSGIAQMMDDMAATLTNPTLAAELATPMPPLPPLFDLIDAADLDAIRAALDHENVNQTAGDYDSTPLYHAMSHGFSFSLEVISLLLDAGADPKRGLGDTNVLHGLGFAVIREVAPQDLAAVISRCCALGADIEQRSDMLLWTPLMTAASERNPIAVEALLLAGANIHARAGEVDNVCFSGAAVLAFADGHAETTAVLQRYATQN